MRSNSVTLAHKGMEFEVEVLSQRTVFGRTEYEVRPVAGAGKAWIQRGSLTPRRKALPELVQDIGARSDPQPFGTKE